jgi:hypothetical protein
LPLNQINKVYNRKLYKLISIYLTNYKKFKLKKMKKSLFVAILFTPFFSMAQNLILNGEFETAGLAPQNFANWTHAPTFPNIVREIGFKMNGQSCVRFTNKTTPAYITSDAITVEPGKTYRLKFTGRIQTAVGASGTLETTEGAALRLSILIWDGTKSKPAKFPALTITSGTNQTVTGDFKPAPGVTAIKLVFGKNKDIAYADDVSFEEIKN